MSNITVSESQVHGGNSDHDGWGQSSSYNFYFDRTLNAAANDAMADGKIDSADIDDVMEGAFDSDQITEREARAFVRWGEANYDNMSPEARKKFELIQATLLKAVGHELSDGRNEHFKGHTDTLALDKTGIDEMKVKLAEIDEAKSKAKPAEKKPPADGMDSGSGSGEPKTKTHNADPTPPKPEHDNYVEAASKMEIPDFANMDWDEILAYFRRLIGAKELDAKHYLTVLAQKLKTAQSKPGETTEQKDAKAEEISNIQQDMQDIQSAMKKIDEMTTMIVNLEKARHETLKFIIQNIGA
jgi:hypothetical protein